MATKVYDSPTSNIFALLADEHAGQSQPKKTNNKAAGANTGSLQESTPKERAEARAVQDAARKQQKEAEKAKKELEAARKKALELVDDTGFSQQRHQRIKDARQQALVEPASPSKSHKPRSKDGWDDTDAKGKGKPWPKADGAKGEGKGKAPAGNKTDLAGSPKTDGKAFNKPKGEGKAANFTKGDGKTFKDNKGDKTFNKGGNFKGEGKVPFKNEGSVAKGAKSYDKHSQGVTSRQFQAKKQGHGKANWDENVPAGLSSAPVKDALASEALAAPAGGDVDGWGDSPAAPGNEAGATDAAQTDDKDNDAKDSKKEDDEDADKKTLDEYLHDQAEKKKALEAVVKALTPQTTVTEEEKKALSSKFTFFENPQAAPKTEAPKVAAVAPKAPAAATPAPPAIATGFRVAGSRAGGRGGRFEGQQRDSPARQGGQRKGGRGPQKILKGKNEFPALSSTTK